MEIKAMNQPLAGRQFRFLVAGGTRPTRIQVYIDQSQVASKDCDDPPCHEIVWIPPGTRGSEVRIVASNLLGSTEERRFTIADAEASGGGMMSAGG
jgi:hypothetical protein